MPKLNHTPSKFMAPHRLIQFNKAPSELV